MGPETDPEADEDPFLGYVHLYRLHLEQTSAFIRGKLPGNVYHEPTFHPPGGYWEPEEKDAFFHALSVYSRWRPDLIADKLENKSILDVCMYLDSLEEAVKPNTVANVRDNLEIALEAPEHWIELEDEHSTELIERESEWWKEAEKAQRREYLSSAASGVERQRMVAELKSDEEIPALLHRLDNSALRALGNIAESPADPRREESATPDDSPHPSPAPKDPEASDEEATPDLSQYSPSSRRRIQKRLHMRRKRAEKAGTAYNSSITKMKPGKPQKRTTKPKSKSKTASGSTIKSKPFVESEDEDDSETEKKVVDRVVSESKSSPEPDDKPASRKTKDQKVAAVFQEHDITSETLEQYGLDLFDLPAVGRFIRRFRNQDNDKSSALEAIENDAVRLFRAVIVDFITQAVHISIVSREQEVRLKKGIKVWTMLKPEEIQLKNVEHAVQLLGMATSIGHQRRKLNQNEDDEDIDMDEEGSMSVDVNVIDPDRDPVSRDIQAPLVQRPLRFLHQSELEPWRKRVVVDEPMMDVDTDEEALEAELEEEDALDQKDTELELDLADNLWDLRQKPGKSK